MQRYRQTKKPVAEINVVPYIDVMLVLLVIFMITAPLLTQGVSVDLPQASAKVFESQTQEPIIVSVDKAGRYYINVADDPNKPISAEDLLAFVAAQLKLDDKRPILVNGDRAVDYGKVIHAMVLIQQAGADTVGLMTKDSDKQV